MPDRLRVPLRGPSKPAQDTQTARAVAHRDSGLDLLRGYFILVIIINHLGSSANWTHSFTGGNQLWVSAAEGFVLISGLLFGRLYRARVRDWGWPAAIDHVGRRSLLLYTVGALGQLVLTSSDYLLRRVAGLETDVPESYLEIVQNALLQIRYVHYGVDLLPLYAFLLLGGLLAIYLLERGRARWLVAGSILLWYARRLDPTAFVWLRVNFSHALWQLLFTIGLIGGYYHAEFAGARARLAIPRWLVSALLIVPAATILFLSERIAFHGLWSSIGWVQTDGDLFNRETLAPGRVLAAVWVFAALCEVTRMAGPSLARWLGWLLLPLGRHSLVAYIVQAFFAYGVAKAARASIFPDAEPRWPGFLELAGLFLVWGLTLLVVRLLALLKNGRRSSVGARQRYHLHDVRSEG